MLPHIYILLLLSLVLIVLALRLFMKYQKSESINYFATMFLGLAALAIVTSVVIASGDDATVLFATRLGYYVGAIVFSMMLMFSCYYPIPSPKIPRRKELFWIIPVTFFLPYILMSTLSVQGIDRINGVPHEGAGSGFFVFPIFVAVYVLCSMVNLSKKLRLVQGEQKRNLQFVLLGLLLGSIASLVFDTILPYFGYQPLHYVSVEVSSVLIGVTAYIATRK